MDRDRDEQSTDPSLGDPCELTDPPPLADEDHGIIGGEKFGEHVPNDDPDEIPSPPLNQFVTKRIA